MKHIGRSFPETTPEHTPEITPEITPEAAAELDAPAAPELESLTISQLRDLATEDGIDLGKAKTKAEIIAAFNEAME
ncbi:MAG: hypothetical protein ACI4SF_12830 [Oscillospiraceae bacterium]